MVARPNNEQVKAVQLQSCRAIGKFAVARATQTVVIGPQNLRTLSGFHKAVQKLADKRNFA